MQTPEDLRKLKLFVWAGDAKLVEIWRKAGFQPVPLETADIVPMLDTGLINVVPMPPFAALASQVHDRAPHMLELNWGALIGAMVIRKAAWDKLPQATRQELLQAAQEAGRQNKEHGRAESDRAVTVMQSKGLKVQPTTPEIVAEWQRAVEKIYPQIKGTIVPADIFEEVERILQEYRTSGGTAK